MEKISESLARTISRLFGAEVAQSAKVVLTLAPEGTGADYASNIALQLASRLSQAPRAVAEQICQDLMKDSADFSVEIAGPGFLNFRLNDECLIDAVKRQISGEMVDSRYQGKTIVVEFSDPNPFKILHVGHLYTSVVGDAISRLMEYAGAKVVRANFGGDVGLHVAKNLWAVQQADFKPEDLTIEILSHAYVDGTRAYEDDEKAKAEITALNKEIYRINAEDLHDSETAQLYWHGRELSYDYFKDFYRQIGLTFDKYYPESSVAERGLTEVKSHTPAVYQESNGAIIFEGEKVGLHTRVFINREGVPTYEAKDVGLIFTKWDDWKFDESVVITGNEQTDYMKVVLASVREYAPELVERTEHLTHGMVRLPGNTKMSSRKGNFLKAVDVIAMVEERASALEGAESDNDSQRTEDLALAAIKYAFLKYRVGGDIIFDPAESVAISGNSGIYIIYSLIRAQKILAKVQQEVNIAQLTNLQGENERRLAKKLMQYEEVLGSAILEKAPYKICNFLFEVAQEFSRFYEREKVAGDPREAERAVLVQGFVQIVKHGLELLGIEKIPESM